MEIERKWLVNPEKIPFNLTELEKISIEQVYVSFSPTIRARKLNGGEAFILTVKTKPEGPERELARNEYEMPLTASEYESLRVISRGRVIIKTRYLVPLENGLKMEIDIFKGEFYGLAYLEIEFPDIASAEAFPTPDWVIEDVTYKKEYKNGYLARNGMPGKKGNGYGER